MKKYKNNDKILLRSDIIIIITYINGYVDYKIEEVDFYSINNENN